MLSRTADHLFWMARYMERAENTARMLDVNYQTALLPQSAAVAEQGWQGLLSISELTRDYTERYGAINPRQVMAFMVRDERNPSSILSCLRAARENARAVRGTLTTEVWETTNQTWLEFNRMLADGTLTRDPASLFEWVKFRSHLSRGVTVGTMLQDEAFHFIRIGSFLERADNTARLLDVKFHAVQSDFYGAADERDSEYDFYHWSAILRSVSGFEVYRKVYRNVIQPEKVAELLILRHDMPRSLAACMHEVVTNLKLVANEQSADTQRRAGRLMADLEYGRIDEILSTGLHAYLTQFLDRVGDLGAGISRDFLVTATAA
ncbi:MAG: alpha-E domain-containing protein [Pseudomonadota bacterium]